MFCLRGIKIDNKMCLEVYLLVLDICENAILRTHCLGSTQELIANCEIGYSSVTSIKKHKPLSVRVLKAINQCFLVFGHIFSSSVSLGKLPAFGRVAYCNMTTHILGVSFWNFCINVFRKNVGLCTNVVIVV